MGGVEREREGHVAAASHHRDINTAHSHQDLKLGGRRGDNIEMQSVKKMSRCRRMATVTANAWSQFCRAG